MAYPGGKSGSGVYQTIINQLPPHRVYIEPFLGGGAILRLKKPAFSSIAIDRDSDVIIAFPGDRIPNLTLICDDAIDWLASHNIPSDALIYLDPPYLLGTRSCQRQLYRCELTDADHERLLTILQGLRFLCSIAISGYPSRMYSEMLSGWRMVQFQARTRGGKTATECLWMNYPAPLELHDYRYLGENFRERERIKRKQNRWRNRLATMTSTERYAMLSVIEDLRSAGSAGYDDTGPQELTRATTPIYDDAIDTMAGAAQDGPNFLF